MKRDNLSKRAKDILDKLNVSTNEELYELTYEQLVNNKNVGKITAQEIVQYANKCKEEDLKNNTSTDIYLRYKILENRKELISMSKNPDRASELIADIMTDSAQVNIKPTILYQEERDINDFMEVGGFYIGIGNGFAIVKFRGVSLRVDESSPLGQAILQWYETLFYLYRKDDLTDEEKDMFEALSGTCTLYIAMFFQSFFDDKVTADIFNYIVEKNKDLYKEALEKYNPEDIKSNSDFEQLALNLESATENIAQVANKNADAE